MAVLRSKLSAFAVCLLFLISLVAGHLVMQVPAPFNAANNPNSQNIDYNLMAPLAGLAQYPCKGYHTLMGSRR